MWEDKLKLHHSLWGVQDRIQWRALALELVNISLSYHSVDWLV